MFITVDWSFAGRALPNKDMHVISTSLVGSGVAMAEAFRMEVDGWNDSFSPLDDEPTP